MAGRDAVQLNGDSGEPGSSRAPHVAIVGGGIAGVAACKALVCRSISCVLFEGKERLGGLWVNNYPSAAAQVFKDGYQLPDAPFPDSAALLPTQADICDYCDAYATEWKLWPHLRLSTPVSRVSRNACTDADPSGTFSVEYADSASGSDTTETFTHVVVATGELAVPYIPEIPGADQFAGRLLHSSKRRDNNAELAGRHVVVVGNGKSAQDAALDALNSGAVAVTQVVRTMHWTIPLRFHWFFHNRNLQRAFPLYPTRRLGPLAACMRAVTAPLRWLNWRQYELCMLAHYRLPRRLWPRRSLVHDFTGIVISVYRPEYMRAVRSGAIAMHLGDMECIEEGAVVIQPRGGRCTRPTEAEPEAAARRVEVQADTIVMATGFQQTSKPLAEDIVKGFEADAEGVYLYKHLMHPSCPNLLFCGHTLPAMAPHTFAVQGAWIGEFLLGNIPQPSEAEMHAHIALKRESFKKYLPERYRSKYLLAHSDMYHVELMRDMHTDKLARYGGPFGPIANAVLPKSPTMSANALQPTEKRSKKSLKPPRLLKVLVVASVALLVRGTRHRHCTR